MTKDEFFSLSASQQDEFLNSGQSFSEPPSKEEQKVETTDTLRLVSEVKDEVTPYYSPQPSIPSQDFTEGFDILDPVELLFMLDDDIASGRVVLHDWQIQFMMDFASQDFTDGDPFQAVVRACNGSGKDKYVIAPCIVWLCMRFRLARGIVTSASGVQLDNQTCKYISLLCENANRKFGQVWKINYRAYLCIPTESPIICYATDEKGKAEGFHPLAYARKMGIFVSEDKSVGDDINEALNKCTGYTHRVHVSTPGLPMGHFYDLCSTGVARTSIKSVGEVKPEDYIHYHIRARDCSHIRAHYIEQMKRDLPGGEFGAAYKSQVDAEFGTTDELVVVPYKYVWNAVKHEIAHIPEEHNTGGLDLSDGGDETVLTVRNGNKLLKVIPFRFDNAEDTIEYLNDKFEEVGLKHHKALINSDCGGLGKPMLDRMKRMGWVNIRYCDNRNSSNYPATYKNWGAQSWFHLAKLLEQGEISLAINDEKMNRQVSTRYFKIIDGRVHQLLSKVESRSRGYPSPDRADSLVLCFSNYKSTYVPAIEKKEEKPFEPEPAPKQVTSEFTLKGNSKGFDSGKARWNINQGQKDFSELEEQIQQYNKLLKVN